MNSYTGSIEAAAYHEAAHAVAHNKVLYRFKEVTILPYLDAKDGDWVHPRPVPMADAEINIERRSYNGLLKSAFICLAAPALEEHQRGQYDEIVYAQDIADARCFVQLTSQKDKEPYNTLPPLDEAWGHARKFVRSSFWQPKISLIAKALLRSKTLTYSEFSTLLNR